MSKPRSNSRRFVNAAWSLLTFQLIASIGAVAVTGWAAFHVSGLTIERSAPQVEPVPPSPFGEQGDGGAAPQPAPGTPQPTPPPAEAQQQPLQAARCPRDGYEIRVDANAGWCDTGLVLQQAQGVVIEARGRWSNAGDPQYSAGGIEGYRHPGTIVADATLASLIGRVGDTAFGIGGSTGFTSPASGPLYLSINDVPGTFEDNRGWLVVTIGAPQVIQ